MIEFVKMPSDWIRHGEPGLRKLCWGGQDNAGKVAALMLYIAIAHNANREATREYEAPGFAKLSYSDFRDITGLSRAKISRGLRNLEELGIIDTDKTNKTSIYKIAGYNPAKGWAKLPYQHLYQKKEIKFFHSLHLRQKVELNALKMYLLVVAFRDKDKNHASISYPKINHYTGINTNDIRSAISLLVTHNLIHVDHFEDDVKANGSYRHNLYRVVGLKGRTSGSI
jgi:DNA-binding Lrp family transcriptional regulator